MQYSVSPRLKPINLGPNPIENLSTRIPQRLAARKCPSSWMKIRKPSVKMARIIPFIEPNIECHRRVLYYAVRLGSVEHETQELT